MKSVYCIVVTYNGLSWVDKCLGSLQKADYPIKTIVVDNGSGDGTQGAILQRFPEVMLIQSPTNLGFGKANNLGIQQALEKGAEYILLLNQDAYLHQGSFRGLIEAFDQEPAAGIVSPMHLAGDEQNLDWGFYRYCNPADTPGLLGDLVKGDLKPLYRSAFVNAAAWVLKAEVIKRIGLFHPIFDHYVEDNEYVHRLESRGLGLYVYTGMKIVHDRPQKKRDKAKNSKRSMMYKQRMLYKYCTGQFNSRQVDATYLKIILTNLMGLNLQYSTLSMKNWLDVRKKIKEYTKYDYTISTTR